MHFQEYHQRNCMVYVDVDGPRICYVDYWILWGNGYEILGISRRYIQRTPDWMIPKIFDWWSFALKSLRFETHFGVIAPVSNHFLMTSLWGRYVFIYIYGHVWKWSIAYNHESASKMVNDYGESGFRDSPFSDQPIVHKDSGPKFISHHGSSATSYHQFPMKHRVPDRHMMSGTLNLEFTISQEREIVATREEFTGQRRNEEWQIIKMTTESTEEYIHIWMDYNGHKRYHQINPNKSAIQSTVVHTCPITNVFFFRFWTTNRTNTTSSWIGKHH